jgi:hypothetical protein
MFKKNIFLLVMASAIVFSCLACATSKQPILAPNAHLQEVGQAAAQRDIAECMRLAMEAGPGTTRGRQIGGQTAWGAAVGSAAGAVAGTISGSPGIGAASGAAGGATAGLLSGLFGLFRSSDLNSGQQRFVEDCLRQKGYNPNGWR